MCRNHRFAQINKNVLNNLESYVCVDLHDPNKMEHNYLCSYIHRICARNIQDITQIQCTSIIGKTVAH